MILSRQLTRWAPLPLRLIIGGGFIQHGVAKWMHGASNFAAILQALNVPFPHLMALLTITTEIIGGCAVLLGAFIPLAAVPMTIVLLVAIFTVHLSNGFSSIRLKAVVDGKAQFGPPGYECDLLYIAGLVTLVLGGPGPLALTRPTRTEAQA
ncbi:MAG TPA: DoxX family protein [Acidobacteriaceae bacterium]|nr:DoxX family protein [Acidobacteriaceae bacterium]